MSTGLPPPTYVPTFHGDYEAHPWISRIPFRVLGRTGLQVSTLSYGGSALGDFYGSVNYAEAVETIQESIRCGINYLDTSPWYGNSEAIIGEALKTVPREAYYIGTKVGRYFTPTWENRFDFSGQAVLKSVEKSLQLLGLDYVDIIQIHDAEFCLDRDLLLKETLPALESVVRAGKAKFIGITGYDLELLKTLSTQAPSIVDTILSYSRFNFHDTALESYVPHFANLGIGVINASPVAMGLLTTAGPPSWHPSSAQVKTVARYAAELATNSGTTLETAALGFSLRPKNGNIATTLVSMPTREILKSNLGVVAETVSKADEDVYAAITELFTREEQPCSWEGVELEEYKEFMRNK